MGYSIGGAQAAHHDTTIGETYRGNGSGNHSRQPDIRNQQSMLEAWNAWPSKTPDSTDAGDFTGGLEASSKSDAMQWNTIELNPLSSSEKAMLRSKKYRSYKNRKGRQPQSEPYLRQKFQENNIILPQIKSIERSMLNDNGPSKLDMFNNDELTSFPLAPPPSNSISNMDQILNDSSNIDISFESANTHTQTREQQQQQHPQSITALTNVLQKVNEQNSVIDKLFSVFNDSLLPTPPSHFLPSTGFGIPDRMLANCFSESIHNSDSNKVDNRPLESKNIVETNKNSDPKIVVSRNDPIVLIEDYIPTSKSSKKRISVVNLRKSIFDLRESKTAPDASCHNDSDNDFLAVDSFTEHQNGFDEEEESQQRVFKKRSKGNLTQEYLNNMGQKSGTEDQTLPRGTISASIANKGSHYSTFKDSIISTNDARKITYNSIRSVKSLAHNSSSEEAYKNKQTLRNSAGNRKSLIYLNNAINLLTRDNKNHLPHSINAFQHNPEHHEKEGFLLDQSQHKTSQFSFGGFLATNDKISKSGFSASATGTNERTVSDNSFHKDIGRSTSSSTEISLADGEPDTKFRKAANDGHKENSFPTGTFPSKFSIEKSSAIPVNGHNGPFESGKNTREKSLTAIGSSHMVATSSRNNSFLDLSDSLVKGSNTSLQGLYSHNQRTSSSILESLNFDDNNKHKHKFSFQDSGAPMSSLKYCMICDRPLYDISSIIQSASCKFRIFVCDGCTEIYNEIALLLNNLEFEINRDPSSLEKRGTGLSLPLQNNKALANLSGRFTSLASMRYDTELNEDEQLTHLAELVAFELNENDSNIIADNADLLHKNEQHCQNVKVYEKLLKLLLLISNEGQSDSEGSDGTESITSRESLKDMDMMDIGEDTTTDLGNDTAKTFALDSNAGFDYNVACTVGDKANKRNQAKNNTVVEADNKNILKDVTNFFDTDARSIRSLKTAKSSYNIHNSNNRDSNLKLIPLPKQRSKQTNANFQEYYRSIISKPSTTRVVSTNSDNHRLSSETAADSSGFKPQQQQIPEHSYKQVDSAQSQVFSSGLITTLHKQLDEISAMSDNIKCSTPYSSPNSKFGSTHVNSTSILSKFFQPLNNGAPSYTSQPHAFRQLNINSITPTTTSTTSAAPQPLQSQLQSHGNGDPRLNKRQSLLNLDLEQEWVAFKKKFRWRWRIKGLMPGIDIHRSETYT